MRSASPANSRRKTWSSLASAVAITLAAPLSAAADGLSLPYAPQAPGGQDSIETAGGTRCRSSINNGGPVLDIGVGHIRDQTAYEGGAEEMSSIGYARIVIPLGARPERLNCKRLYDLEIARLKMELELLRMGMN